MKQTAVEWLYFEINKRGPKENNPPQWLIELYEQAKAMEKEQIMTFAKLWEEKLLDGRINSVDDLYNETYENTK